MSGSLRGVEVVRVGLPPAGEGRVLTREQKSEGRERLWVVGAAFVGWTPVLLAVLCTRVLAEEDCRVQNANCRLRSQTSGALVPIASS